MSSHGAGGGQGPNPIALPTDDKHALQVQVIGQQWKWTFRFPTYGGLETDHLELPVGTDVEFHVTSLDVTHSFWAYELGVKADAVPGADNVAFVHPRRLGTFPIRCAELCGLWHGHMYQTGAVVTPTAFAAFITSEQGAELPNLRYLPPYQKHLLPRAAAARGLMVESTRQLPTAAAGRPRGVLAFNAFTAIALGIGGFFLGATSAGRSRSARTTCSAPTRTTSASSWASCSRRSAGSPASASSTIRSRASLGRPASLPARGDERRRRATSGSAPTTR